jgi:hypothetical protein
MNRIDKYTRQIESFNWSRIKSEAHEEGYAFLGSVFSITPSGKFYMPFACSNVMGCKRCRGTGSVKRRAGNAERLAEAQSRLDAIDLRGIIAAHGGYAQWPESVRAEVDAARAVVESAKTTRQCEWCGGSGSHEAAQDEDWWDALAVVAKRHGLFVGGPDGGAGDDVFVGDATVLDDDGNYDGGESHGDYAFAQAEGREEAERDGFDYDEQ